MGSVMYINLSLKFGRMVFSRCTWIERFLKRNKEIRLVDKAGNTHNSSMFSTLVQGDLITS